MARTPSELQKLTASELSYINHLERAIDQAMDQSCYSGGRFEFRLKTMLPNSYVAELQKRYRGWVLEYEHRKYIWCEPDHFLVFKPLPRGGSSDSRGPTNGT